MLCIENLILFMVIIQKLLYDKEIKNYGQDKECLTSIGSLESIKNNFVTLLGTNFQL